MNKRDDSFPTEGLQRSRMRGTENGYVFKKKVIKQAPFLVNTLETEVIQAAEFAAEGSIWGQDLLSLFFLRLQ